MRVPEVKNQFSNFGLGNLNCTYLANIFSFLKKKNLCEFCIFYFFKDMDEKKSIITVDSWMRMGWNDSALVWDPDKFDGVKTMHFESDELWKPDILLYNK